MTEARQEGLLLAALLGPGRSEVSCEVCFAQLDRYVESERGGEQAEKAVPGMAAHLEGCAACREEYRSLHALLASAGTPTRAGPGVGCPPWQPL